MVAPEHHRGILHNRSTRPDAVPPTNEATYFPMKRTAATEAPQKRARKAAAQSRVKVKGTIGFKLQAKRSLRFLLPPPTPVNATWLAAPPVALSERKGR